MKYTDKILKSKTDTEYPGGTIFTDLVKRGTLQPAVTSIDKVGYQAFALDVFCYTRRRLDIMDTRAIILMDTATPTVKSNIKLYLVESFLGGKAPHYIEVLPEPDNEMSFYENQWVHDLKWFLSGHAFSSQLYETMLTYQKTNPITRPTDLFNRPMDTALERIRFVKNVGELLEWMSRASTKAGNRFGYQQRNKLYSPKLQAAAHTWNLKHTRPSVLWGTLNQEKKRFDESGPCTFHGYLFNELSGLIDGLRGDKDALIDNPLIYTLVEAIQDRLDVSSQLAMNPYYSTALTRNKLELYRDQLIETGGIGTLDIWTFLPNLNV